MRWPHHEELGRRHLSEVRYICGAPIFTICRTGAARNTALGNFRNGNAICGKLWRISNHGLGVASGLASDLRCPPGASSEKPKNWRWQAAHHRPTSSIDLQGAVTFASPQCSGWGSFVTRTFIINVKKHDYLTFCTPACAARLAIKVLETQGR